MSRSGVLFREHRQLLLNDFQKEIERIDRRVFGDRGLASASAFSAAACGPEWEELARIGSFVSLFATYLSEVIPLHKEHADKTHTADSQVLDRYVIWTTPVSAWLDALFAGGFDHTGEADATVKEHWSLLAYAIVRVRVLMHAEWFPHVRVRTKENIIRHRGLFVERAEDEISGVRRLRDLSIASAEKLHDPILADVHWTLELVVHALVWGVPEVSALALLYSDDY